ncbi:hypothetical protein O6H91_10G072700 [Diphasiastrum complanatum]|uniref:Uncharacterized protein n=1 Tax=Diphasiastrum complanatum TaxID=34168 RepID=A0ACC2CID3_DIPCM|nr:hypothetical protein O6H91_10G072700 [Diphasiastrum complanatum]
MDHRLPVARVQQRIRNGAPIVKYASNSQIVTKMYLEFWGALTFVLVHGWIMVGPKSIEIYIEIRLKLRKRQYNKRMLLFAAEKKRHCGPCLRWHALLQKRIFLTPSSNLNYVCFPWIKNNDKKSLST